MQTAFPWFPLNRPGMRPDRMSSYDYDAFAPLSYLVYVICFCNKIAIFICAAHWQKNSSDTNSEWHRNIIASRNVISCHLPQTLSTSWWLVSIELVPYWGCSSTYMCTKCSRNNWINKHNWPMLLFVTGDSNRWGCRKLGKGELRSHLVSSLYTETIFPCLFLYECMPFFISRKNITKTWQMTMTNE